MTSPQPHESVQYFYSGRPSYEAAITALMDAARREHELGGGANVPPNWPPDDPRWEAMDMMPRPHMIEFAQDVGRQAAARLNAERLTNLKAMLDEGRIDRPRLAQVLGVKMERLDEVLP